MKALTLIIGLFILAGCGKKEVSTPNPSGGTSAASPTPGTPNPGGSPLSPTTPGTPNPGGSPLSPTTPGILMVPQYKNLIRYQQSTINSCLITSIYMLIHSTNTKGKGAHVDQTHAEYYFNGEKNKGTSDKETSGIDEEELATTNGLKHKLLKAAGGDGHFLNPDDPELCITQCENLLKEAPFILGLPGHAVLVVGIDESSKELIIINPSNPSTDQRIKIEALQNCSDAFFLPQK